ncbi:hypothetical protein [Streptomyces canus]|uniref:hypothetical protein n=1 Tax=Streptomyces canus TaxID=58343 RepID=UPI002781A204|nr:hypothetical protein [Streptomyces canus]MDQ0765993.1 hypothetical protein [Streptomyces canus]MDQ1065918.1 hypothetical protein [Streptomyces canus]
MADEAAPGVVGRVAGVGDGVGVGLVLMTGSSGTKFLAEVAAVLGTGDEFEERAVRLGAPGLERLGGGEGRGHNVGEAAVGGLHGTDGSTPVKPCQGSGSASASAGRLVVHRLLDDGHQVTAVVRTPAKLAVTPPSRRAGRQWRRRGDQRPLPVSETVHDRSRAGIAAFLVAQLTATRSNRSARKCFRRSAPSWRHQE